MSSESSEAHSTKRASAAEPAPRASAETAAEAAAEFALASASAAEAASLLPCPARKLLAFLEKLLRCLLLLWALALKHLFGICLHQHGTLCLPLDVLPPAFEHALAGADSTHESSAVHSTKRASAADPAHDATAAGVLLQILANTAKLSGLCIELALDAIDTVHHLLACVAQNMVHHRLVSASLVFDHNINGLGDGTRVSMPGGSVPARDPSGLFSRDAGLDIFHPPHQTLAVVGNAPAASAESAASALTASALAAASAAESAAESAPPPPSLARELLALLQEFPSCLLLLRTLALQHSLGLFLHFDGTL